jgi:prephenate dehydrogenase
MRIAILGCGRMGAWLARELGRENSLALFDRDPARSAVVPSARRLGDLRELRAFAPELLVNAVTLGETRAVFAGAEPHLPGRCVLADVASIKGGLVEYYAHCSRPWVSLHPMFGPSHTDMQHLQDENAILLSESDPATAKFFRIFFEDRGIRVFACPAAEHDRWMAYALTLPFLGSMSFAACLEGAVPPGTNFRRQQELAAGLLAEDDHLLAEILFNPHSLPQLERLTARLEFLKHILRGRDFDEARRFFEDLRRRLAGASMPAAAGSGG